MHNQTIVGLVLLLQSFCSVASEPGDSLIGNTTTNKVSQNKTYHHQQYIFYSHGYIVEGTDPKPVHQKWGVYDFPAIKQKLAEFQYQLIAAHRAANTDPYEHAEKLALQVNNLLNKGLPEKNIFLIGFSRGGLITAITSSLLKNKELNSIILAACTSRLAKRQDIIIYGHLLSIYETSDSVGSCNEVVARNKSSVTSYKEISITTGLEHGAFYRPLPEWIIPIENWIKFRAMHHKHYGK